MSPDFKNLLGVAAATYSDHVLSSRGTDGRPGADGPGLAGAARWSLG